MLLAGDIGGTKTRLALFSFENGTLVRKNVERFDSHAFGGLDLIAKKFLEGFPPPEPIRAACFGVPGPVTGGKVKITNLPWTLSEPHLSQELGIPKVRLVNDLVGTAAAIPLFTPKDLMVLHPGEQFVPEPDEPVVSAVVAPGTGLGHAAFVRNGGRSEILASEAGHVSFSPVNAVEIDLLRYLQQSHKHVSAEVLLSGPGLFNIYKFLRDTGYAPESPELAEEIRAGDPAAAIYRHCEMGISDLCVRAVELFCSVLGAHAGNIMLSFLAFGGIYLGGGIPPKLASRLAKSGTVAAYLGKGKLAPVVSRAPLYVIMDDHAALTGTALLASRL